MQKWKVPPARVQRLGITMPPTSVIAYFLFHVGVQGRNIGNFAIVSQRFAKASKVKNLGNPEK